VKGTVHLVHAGLEPGLRGRGGQLLEIDGVFIKRLSLQPT
jgi:hypothetical protein